MVANLSGSCCGHNNVKRDWRYFAFAYYFYPVCVISAKKVKKNPVTACLPDAPKERNLFCLGSWALSGSWFGQNNGEKIWRNISPYLFLFYPIYSTSGNKAKKVPVTTFSSVSRTKLDSLLMQGRCLVPVVGITTGGDTEEICHLRLYAFYLEFVPLLRTPRKTQTLLFSRDSSINISSLYEKAV